MQFGLCVFRWWLFWWFLRMQSDYLWLDERCGAVAAAWDYWPGLVLIL